MKQARLVFVVDDEPVISRTLTLILNARGYAAQGFTDPVSALSKAQEGPPDVLVSDVMMPGLTGVELAIRMRSFHPQCAILLFSGQATTASLLEVARGEGHDFTLLQKPVHPNELIAEIESAWAALGFPAAGES